MNKSYSEMARLNTFDERFQYLKMKAMVGQSTFGFSRYLNQQLYTSRRWLETRDKVIMRDEGCDLGIDTIRVKLLVHHINPLTLEDLETGSSAIFDLENLITTSHDTHQAIHYGNTEFLENRKLITRRPNDTSPWR